MNNRLVVFSDMHLHPWAYGSRVNDVGFNSRMYGIYEAALQVVDYCHTEGIRTAVFCGDLFHTHSKVDTGALMLASRIFDEFKSKGINVVVLVGNHDMASKDGYIHSLSWLNAYDNVKLVNTFDKFVVNGIQISALAYTENDEFIEQFLSGWVEDGDIVLMHQGVAGVPMASGWVLDEKLTPSMIPDKVKHCFIGHYHSHNKVTDKITVVGSLTHQTWADVGTIRGFLDYDLDTNVVTQIRTNAPEFMRADFGASTPIDDFQHQGPGGFKDKMIHAINFNEELSISEVREDLLSWGALSVKFDVTQSTNNGVKPLLHYSGDFSVSPIIEKYEEGIANSRTLEVGKSVREGNYGIPEV